MWIQEISVAVLVCLLIWHFPKLLNVYKKYPPGPPILLLAVKFIKAGFSIDPEMFAEMAKDYGSIYTIWRFHMPVIVVTGFQALHEVLVKHSKIFSGRPVTRFIQDISSGKGLIFANGETWKQQRKFGVTSLRKLGLGNKGVQNHIEDEACELVQAFACAKGQPMDPSLPLSNSTANVICALVFRHRYSVDDEEFMKLIKAHDISVEFGSSFANFLYEVSPWLVKQIQWPNQNVFDSVDFVLSHAREQTEMHRQQLAVHDPQDYIDYYLLQMEKSKNDPTSTYEVDNLVQSISDLFSAGTSTIRNTLLWALFLMVSYPDIQEKVQKDLEDAFGSSQTISYADRKKVPYTWAVIHEVQRFKCVIVSLKPRLCLQDVTVLGCFIPKGTVVIPDVHSVCNDPKIWETPRKFNPNHFLDKDGKFVDRDELIIFGAGARTCIGKELAMMEIFTFFTSLLKAFTFKLPEGVTKLNATPTKGAQLSPQPFKICAVPRFSES